VVDSGESKTILNSSSNNNDVTATPQQQAPCLPLVVSISDYNDSTTLSQLLQKVADRAQLHLLLPSSSSDSKSDMERVMLLQSHFRFQYVDSSLQSPFLKFSATLSDILNNNNTNQLRLLHTTASNSNHTHTPTSTTTTSSHAPISRAPSYRK
jgi:hypothetical protein